MIVNNTVVHESIWWKASLSSNKHTDNRHAHVGIDHLHRLLCGNIWVQWWRTKVCASFCIDVYIYIYACEYIIVEYKFAHLCLVKCGSHYLSIPKLQWCRHIGMDYVSMLVWKLIHVNKMVPDGKSSWHWVYRVPVLLSEAANSLASFYSWVYCSLCTLDRIIQYATVAFDEWPPDIISFLIC